MLDGVVFMGWKPLVPIETLPDGWELTTRRDAHSKLPIKIVGYENKEFSLYIACTDIIKENIADRNYPIVVYAKDKIALGRGVVFKKHANTPEEANQHALEFMKNPPVMSAYEIAKLLFPDLKEIELEKGDAVKVSGYHVTRNGEKRIRIFLLFFEGKIKTILKVRRWDRPYKYLINGQPVSNIETWRGMNRLREKYPELFL